MRPEAASTVQVVDTTIRDGGYIIHHCFPGEVLATIVGGLARAGVRYIEVGHGMGVGCTQFHPSIRPQVLPPLGDADHARIALAVAGDAKVGVTMSAGKRFVPIDYLGEIARLGFHFVRLIVLPDDFADSLPYVTEAKRLGLTVSINLAQSYASTAEAVASMAAEGADCGLDWFYVVDSAGGMSESDVRRYVSAVRANTTVAVGFHGHNNLGLALANCLAAIDEGATFVDGTLLGMGRATGNPCTEQLLLALHRQNLGPPVHIDRLVGLGRATRSLQDPGGNDPFDFVSGAAQIHSRNLSQVLDAARRYRRPPCAFLLAAGARARAEGLLTAFSFDETFFEKVAEATPAQPENSDRAIRSVARQFLTASGEVTTANLLDRLHERKYLRHKRSVLHVSRSAHAWLDRPIFWETESLVGVTLASSSMPEVPRDRTPDVLAVDPNDTALVLAGVPTVHAAIDTAILRAAEDLAMALGASDMPLWLDGELAARATHASATTRARPGGPAILVTTSPAMEAREADRVFVAAGCSGSDVPRKDSVPTYELPWPDALGSSIEQILRLRDGLASERLLAGANAQRPDRGSSAADDEAGLLVTEWLAGTRRF